MTTFEFTDNLATVTEKIESAIRAALIESAGEIVSKTQRDTPVDTGQLKGSWKSVIDESKYEFIVGSPLENSVWNEFGTGHYAVKKNGRSTPWYVSVDGYVGTKKPTYNGKVTIVHGKNGKEYYKTNGKRPQRTFENAINAVKPHIENHFKTKLEVTFD